MQKFHLLSCSRRRESMQRVASSMGSRLRENDNTVTYTRLLALLAIIIFNMNSYAQRSEVPYRDDPSVVMTRVKYAKSYIQKYGRQKAILEFNKTQREIFVGDYKGNFFVSPLHPELIGTNQFKYKDSAGNLVVQEEIEKAKTGGGWLKGRLRQNPKTGQYQCRKIYIQPMPGDYFIGSWYHYPTNEKGQCLF